MLRLLVTSVLIPLAAGEQPTVTVVPVPIAAVTITPDHAILPLGGSTQLTVTLRDAGGNTLVGRTIKWTSGNAMVASVSRAGLVTPTDEAGTAAISATSEGKTGISEVAVREPPPPRPSFERGLEGIGLACTVLVPCPEHVRRLWEEHRLRSRRRIGFRVPFVLLPVSVLAALAGAWFVIRRRRVRTA